MRVEKKTQTQQQSNIGEEIGDNWFGRTISETISHIPSNLNKVAVPAILYFGTAYLLGVDAGPVAYGACCAACGTVTGIAMSGALLPMSVGLCIKSCLPVFAMPGL